ncbi:MULTISPECIES: ligase-associated DNA damage response exonuclease [unclassified Cyanobium]|uniref:ligase-associated DNA damage response exonuclease n=1 Tax=unclassified Cyanobium TaxID=2627006 RepID=UPI0020CF479C|nr:MULTISPECIES: ligase-associated DNA damage response exonuclease [unclassified Cyanobium]MCP9833248.1 ligase-associated DNA damage response exonuclease [Cyanobium sp. La Preciosa 7G6]MCP9935889.1 ligase-associated DNA damage response exonuclease [Cyanobium sp. Aljojuca 7A6]
MVLPGDGLIQLTPEGLYCPAADAWIDPWRPVSRALITHGHADHARPGCGEYWAVAAGEGVLRQRLGAGITLTGVGYGQERRLGGALVSFHSAGHVLGSAQIRISAGGETWLISGDYKRDADPSCAPFEPVAADVLITEATFGLPIYRWRPGREVAAEILAWWRAAPQRPSLLFAYAFGKAQRLLAELSALGVDEEVLLHGAVQMLMAPYRSEGVVLPPTRPVSELPRSESLAGRLVIAPPSAHRSPWMKRFVNPQTAFVSGWMAVRGARRRRGFERGFALSDHADWDGLLRTVRDCGARQVYVTHGNSDGLARYLREEQGLAAEPLGRAFEVERSEEGEVGAAAATAVASPEAAS